MKKRWKSGYNEFIYSKKRQDTTLKQYEQSYSLFTDFIDGTTPCNQINEDTISGFIRFIKEKSPSIRNSTINTYLSAIRAMVNYFIKKGYTKPFKISLLNANRLPKTIYTDDELQLLVKKPNFKSNGNFKFSVIRDWTLINFFVATGLRVKTVINIRVKDLNFSSNLINLTYLKCNNPYVIPMTTRLKEVLTEYLHYWDPTPEDFLFPTIHRKQLKTCGLHSSLVNYQKRLGIQKSSTQLYRPTFARIYQRNGGNLSDLKYLMGHNNLSTTMLYLDPTVEDIKLTIDDLNPLDRLHWENNGAKINVMKRTRYK